MTQGDIRRYYCERVHWREVPSLPPPCLKRNLSILQRCETGCKYLIRSPDKCTFLFIFFINTPCSAAAEDGHQTYSGGSVVGKASVIDPEISPTLPSKFHGGGGVKKCEILHHFRHHSTLSRPHWKMQQDIWIMKQTWASMKDMSSELLTI